MCIFINKQVIYICVITPFDTRTAKQTTLESTFWLEVLVHKDQPNECYQHMKTSLLCLTISLWLVMKSPFCVTLIEPRPYFTQGTTLLNLRYNGPPLTYSMMESSGGFLSFDSSFLHDWTPASWCWGSALITFCGTRGKRLHNDMFRVCVKHATLCSEWSLVCQLFGTRDYYKPCLIHMKCSSALLSAQTFAN